MRKQILVVDQAEPVRILLTQALRSGEFSCRVVAVPDSLSALEQIKENVFDLAIIDYSLDSLNGLELCRLLRQNQPEVRLVLMGSVEQSQLYHIREWPELDGFITKPFNLSRLLEIVSYLLLADSSLLPPFFPIKRNFWRPTL